MTKFLNVKEVAARYGVSVWTIWRWNKDDNMSFPKARDLGPKVKRWSIAELDAYDAG